MTTEAEDGAKRFVEAFSDERAVAHYAEGPPRFVPGFDSLHRMTSVLLAERAAQFARRVADAGRAGVETDRRGPNGAIR